MNTSFGRCLLLCCLLVGCGGDSDGDIEPDGARVDAPVVDAPGGAADAAAEDAGPDEPGLACPTYQGFTIVRRRLDLFAVTSGNGTNVVMGGGGAMYVWSEGDIDGGCHLSVELGAALGQGSDLYFDGTSFYAFGGNTILRSEDGLAWTAVSVPEALVDVRDMVRFGGALVVVGADSVWTRSDDGEWTQRASFPDTDEFAWRAIAAGPSRAVIVGDVPSVQGVVFLTSTDGITWTEINPGFSNSTIFADIAFGAAGFVAITDSTSVAHSVDGITWTEHDLPMFPDNLAITYGAGVYVVLSDIDETVFVSANGQDWSTRSFNTRATLAAVHHTGSQLVAVGTQGTVITSPDAMTFSQARGSLESSLLDVVYGPPFVAAFDQDIVISSSDGISWQIARSSDTDQTDLAYGGSFVLAGLSLDAVREPFLATSADGGSWLDTHLAGEIPYAVTHGSLGWMATAGAAVYRSTDAMTWTPTSVAATGTLRDIASLNGIYLAVSRTSTGDLLYRTTDGTTWSSAPMPDGRARYLGVTGDKLVVVHDSCVASASADGVSFTRIDSACSMPRVTGFSSTDGRVFVLGGEGRLAATDGQAWQEIELGVPYDLFAIARGGDRWVIVGDGELIMTADAADAPL